MDRVAIKPKFKDVFDRYAIKKRKIKFGKINLIQFVYKNRNLVDENGDPEDIVDIESILFRKDNDGHMTPYIYEFRYDENNKPVGKVVRKNTIVYDFILFSKEAKSITNVKTGKKKSGSLYPMQYVICIPIILSCIRAEGTSHLIAGCRQLGKTDIINNLMAGFISIFAPLYMDLQNGYFSMVTSSYKDPSVAKAYENTQKYVHIAIELHNKMYPKTPLVTGKKFKKTETSTGKANADVFDIGKNIGGQQLLYSRIYAITTNTDQDGLTSNCTFLDEPQLTSMERFKPIAPFTDSVSGITVFTGIGSEKETDVSSTYYRQRNEDKDLIKTYRIPGMIHLNMIAYTDLKRYNSMLLSFYSKMLMWGGMTSVMAQKHYFASFTISSGKFLTKAFLRALNAETLEYNVRNLTRPKTDTIRRVTAVDLATVSDYCVLTTLDVFADGMDNTSDLTDIGSDDSEVEFNFKYLDGITFNEGRNRIDFKVTAKSIAEYCKKASTDILILDATSADVSASIIHDEILELGITTLVIPFKFSGGHKESMMWYFESVLFGGLLKLLKDKDVLFGARKLIEELLYLLKYKSTSGKMQWEAPNGTTFTDDHVMSIAMAVYAIKHLIMLQNKKRPMIPCGVKELDPYDDRFIDIMGNRFKDEFLDEDENSDNSTFLDFFK